MRTHVGIAGDRHLETLGNCGGFYSCPKSEGTGERLGPLVGYAGTYEGPDGKPFQFVGDIYANFAKAEPHAHVLRFFAGCLAIILDVKVGIRKVDVLCGAPIGGYSLADAIGLENNIRMVKAEKQITAIRTLISREKSELVFSRHDIEKGDRCVIVEDVCNNFSTTGKFVRLIRSRGGIVVAILCFLNRSLEVENTFYLSLDGEADVLAIPVVSLVRLPINEWRQDDPAVADDVVRGNVVWKPKNEWDRLMQAMKANA